jgi:hypothetical protein
VELRTPDPVDGLGAPISETFREDPEQRFPAIAPGLSPYAALPLEQKAVLDIRALELMPNAAEPAHTDNEVMMEIQKQHAELS